MVLRSISEPSSLLALMTQSLAAKTVSTPILVMIVSRLSSCTSKFDTGISRYCPIILGYLLISSFIFLKSSLSNSLEIASDRVPFPAYSSPNTVILPKLLMAFCISSTFLVITIIKYFFFINNFHNIFN